MKRLKIDDTYMKSRIQMIPLMSLIATLALVSLSAAAEQQMSTQMDPSRQRFKVVVGSCLHQDKAQPIWQPMLQEHADLFMLLGDNIYGDTEDMGELEQKYHKQWSTPGMQKMLASTPTIGIWDDHDFGENDAGKAYPQKEASRQIMLDYFNEPKDSIRRRRDDGIYTSYFYGESPHRVQIILPDLRWNRDDLKHVTRLEYALKKKPNNQGPYVPHTEPSHKMLGDKQWAWLEKELQKPADVRILASSLQLLPEFSGWESWANFPQERQRLLDVIDSLNITNLVIVSGDTHWSELSQVKRKNGASLWEMTSSGLTEEWKQVSPNKHRVGNSFSKANYGVLDIQFEEKGVRVTMIVKDDTGEVKMQQALSLH